MTYLDNPHTQPPYCIGMYGFKGKWQCCGAENATMGSRTWGLQFIGERKQAKGNDKNGPELMEVIQLPHSRR